MIERIFKAIFLVLLSILYIPSFLVVTLLGGTWKDLLAEFGL